MIRSLNLTSPRHTQVEVNQNFENPEFCMGHTRISISRKHF